MRLLVCVQLVLIAIAGVGVALRLPIWSFADEREHAAYVDAVSRGHLPVMGRDLVGPNLAALGGGSHGLSYEAFQPPLYYVVSAVPWYLARVAGGIAVAVRAVRLVDLLYLGVTLGLLWLLAGRVLRRREDRLAAFALALTFVAWPGVVFRSVTIANTTLEMPLATGAMLALWIAWEDRSPRALLVASLLCGLGLLCRLPFPLVVLVPVVAWRLRRTAPRTALAACALPVILVAPWVLDNIHRYGALTAVAQLRRAQLIFFNPQDKPYGVVRLLHSDIGLLNGILPEEWSNTTSPLYASLHGLSLSFVHVLRGVLVVSILLPLGVWLRTGPRRMALLFAPLFIGLLFTQIDTIIVRLPLSNSRYVYSLLPAFGLAAGVVYTKAVGWPRTAVLAGSLSGALIVLWLYLATVTPITN